MLLSASLAAAILLHRQQDGTAKKITLTGDAKPLSSLIADVSKASGVRLRVAPNLANEIVLVRVKDVPWQEVLNKVAEVTGGYLSSTGSEIRLALNSGTDQAQRTAEAKARVDAYRLALDSQAANYARLTLEQYRQAVRAGTAKRELSEIYSLFGEWSDDVLASVRPGRRLVFSTAPTGRQLRLPAGSLARFTKLTLGPPTAFGFRRDTTPNGAPAVAWIVLREESGYPGFDANVFVADNTGKVIGWNKRVISQAQWTSEPPKVELKHPEALVALDKEAKAFAQTISLDRQTQLAGFDAGNEENAVSPPAVDMAELNRPAPKSVSARLLRPEAEEPLAWTVGAPLTQIAASEGLPLVALLPDDSLVGSLDALRSGSQPANEYVQSMIQRGNLAFAEEGGWMVVRPSRLVTAREARLNRAALGATMRALAARGTLTLDEQAAEATAQPLVGPTDNFEVAFVGALNSAYGSRVGTSIGSGERILLRLFRAMGGQSAFLTSGAKSRSVGSLPPEARKWLEELVYNSERGPDFIGPQDQFPRETLPQLITQERTFRWPNGIPSDLTFTLSEESEDAYFGIAPSGLRPRITTGGWSISVGDEGKYVATSVPRLATYVKGKLRRIAFTLSEGDVRRFVRHLQEDQIGPNAARVAFEDLPEPIRKNIESAEEGIRKSIEDQQKNRQTTP
jgi:hypothetical protein